MASRNRHRTIRSLERGNNNNPFKLPLADWAPCAWAEQSPHAHWWPHMAPRRRA